MQGIDIIRQEEIYTSNPIWLIIGFLGAMVLLFILVPLASAYLPKKFYQTGIVAAALIPIVFELSVCILGVIFAKEPTGRFKYEAVIDDSVSLVEFYNKYTDIHIDEQGIFYFVDK